MNGVHQKVYHSISKSIQEEKFAEGGFRIAYKCSSGDKQFPGTWLLKKYNNKAKEQLLSIRMREEEHARKQVQMHNLAKSIAEQMARKLGRKFGEMFSYNSAFLGKIQSEVDGFSEIVTIEKFIEGSPFVKYMNNTGDIDRELPPHAVEKAEALAHFSYDVSKQKFLLVDIQGIDFNLCDPEIANADLMTKENDGDKLNFCMGNLTTEAIDTFFVQHNCNQYSRALGLKTFVNVS